ncbi:MAG: histidinol-phosphate transaminase [Bifidobacteriaceae bacterium]|jgi:histidinol-phosphate aminotransferase|nr:histidinol-phosphate transaminase [Bifidobacteriaceae bacterium]
MSQKVPIRPNLAEVPEYVPGERPPVGRRAYKLSSNEMPLPPLPGVLAAVADAAADLNRYPDMVASGLVNALAAHHDVEPNRLVTGNGSVAVLGHVLSAFAGPGDEVVYPWRSFEAYPILVALTGAKSVQVDLGDAGRIDLKALASAVTQRTRVVMVCSPNNPTGPAVRAGELIEFCDAVPPDVLVVLDEAYIEYITDPDAGTYADVAEAHPNVITLRTFSKAWGLAGLRVGYAMGRPRLISAVRRAATPFGVNAIAQLAATVSLDLSAAMRQRVAQVVAARDEFAAALRQAGWAVPDAQGNFVWLPAAADAVPLARAAEAAGVLVRAFDGDGVRVSAGEPEGIKAFLEVAQSWA